MPNSRSIKKIFVTNFNPIWKSFVILIVGLVITFSVSNYIRFEEESQSKREFALICNEIKTKIFTRINVQTEFLISGSSLFEASNSVTRNEWKRFNKFSGGNVKFIGVQSFGFSSIIKKEELKEHISAIRKEGFPEYTVFPAKDRDIYTPIIYLEPFDKTNARTFGFDMFSEPIRRKAMEQARDQNMPVLSGKVILHLGTKNEIQTGTIMYVPVYKNGPLNIVSERRKAIIGWVFSPFLMDDLMKSILESRFLSDKTNIRLQVYDDNIISPKSLLFDSYKQSIKNNSESNSKTSIIPILFNNKRWTLVFSQPSENTFFFSAKVLIITIGGIIISFLLFALSHSLLITKYRARIIAERMNESLKKNFKKLISSKEKLKNTNHQLQKAKIKAEESDQLKSAFLANMSHEIRTPMNGIMGFTELLKEENLSPEEQRNYIEIIEKSGTRLFNIINDIIDISKIEAGQMNVSLSTTNVDEQMHYIQTFFRPETQDKGIELLLKSFSTEEETIIRTDREKLYAILINLVKNAIKYTVKGTIEFGYKKKNDYIEFFVKDTGIGIPKERQKAIFERFIQADFNDKMARQGAGLGLAIAKAYVELLGGKIWVESEPEIGSTFYFRLPTLVKPKENSIIQNNQPTNQANYNIKNLKILVTEDDKISRMLILKVIESFSKEILTAQTGLEAVEICRNNPDIDLILMDIQMPQMNGYEATREIRKFNNSIIILAQTAFALEGDKEKTIEAGCNGYISKPIKKEELSKLMQYYFGKQQVLN
jgi:signal transduction histidine kinase/ActR/RegA family two-component response regulator/sensor domain CHASE-containing protein